MGQIHERLHILDQRNHCRRERNIVNESGSYTGKKQNKEGNQVAVAVHHFNPLFRNCRNDAGIFHAPHQNEEPHEEHECVQIHLFKSILRIDTTEEQCRHTARHGDRCRFQTKMGMDNEAEDRKRENHKRPAENRFVFHAGHNINFFQLLRTHADTGKIILENEKDCNQDDNDRNENDRSQIHKEVIEIQVCRGTDHDVWRIPDHKCRTAYVAHQYFRNQNRHGRHTEHAAQGNRHGRDQERCRDRINECRPHRRDDRKQNQQLPRRSF